MPEGGSDFSWEVLTHAHKEHSNDWYWALGVLAFVGAGVSVFFGNILLAFIIVIAAISIGVLAARGPHEHTVKVDPRGITVDGTIYPYSSIQSYWIELEEGPPRLFISTRGILAPHFSFELPDEVGIDALDELLRQNTKEEEQGPHLGERFAQMFGL